MVFLKCLDLNNYIPRSLYMKFLCPRNAIISRHSLLAVSLRSPTLGLFARPTKTTMLRRLKWGRISNFVRRLIFCSTDDNSLIKNCDYTSKAEHVACSSSYIYNKRILTKQCICNLPAIAVFQIIKANADVRPHVYFPPNTKSMTRSPIEIIIFSKKTFHIRGKLSFHWLFILKTRYMSEMRHTIFRRLDWTGRPRFTSPVQSSTPNTVCPEIIVKTADSAVLVPARY